VPVRTAAGTPLTGVLALRSGTYHSCAILDDGRASVVCWGFNDNNQVSPLNNRQPPFTAVAGLSGVSALSLTVGGTCAADLAGGFSCWGSNALGESDGKGVAGTTVPAPALFEGLQGLATLQPTYASGGLNFRCVLTAAGGARCVGRGGEGQIGHGVFANALSLQNVSAPAGTFWSPAP
jgi:Regulator of chromosome condensation (RCC1) repeat